MNRESMDIRACEPFRSRLGQWLDDELPDDGCREIEAHLGSCAGCRKVVEDYRTMAGWVRQSRGLESVAPPADVFWQRLRKQLPERRSRWASLWPTFRQAGMRPRYALALAGMIVVMIVAVVFSGDRAVERPAPGDALIAAEPGCVIESVETGVPDASLMVYRSEAQHLTVVWLFADNGSSSSTLTSTKERQT